MGAIGSGTRDSLGTASKAAISFCSIGDSNDYTDVVCGVDSDSRIAESRFLASLGFSLVALSTVVTAVEPFFNWRSRWILMEDTQYQLRRIRDELDYLLATHGDQELRREDVDPFFEQTQLVWRQTSTRWLDERRRGDAVQ